MGHMARRRIAPGKIAQEPPNFACAGTVEGGPGAGSRGRHPVFSVNHHVCACLSRQLAGRH